MVSHQIDGLETTDAETFHFDAPANPSITRLTFVYKNQTEGEPCTLKEVDGEPICHWDTLSGVWENGTLVLETVAGQFTYQKVESIKADIPT